MVVVVVELEYAFNGLCFSSSVFGWQSHFFFHLSSIAMERSIPGFESCHLSTKHMNHDLMISVVCWRKESKSNVLDAVTLKCVADLCLIRPRYSLLFCSFTRQLFGNRIWTFFCTLTRLLLICCWMISIVIVMALFRFSPARDYSIGLIKWRLMIFPAINFTWNFCFAALRLPNTDTLKRYTFCLHKTSDSCHRELG